MKTGLEKKSTFVTLFLSQLYWFEGFLLFQLLPQMLNKIQTQSQKVFARAHWVFSCVYWLIIVLEDS